ARATTPSAAWRYWARNALDAVDELTSIASSSTGSLAVPGCAADRGEPGQAAIGCAALSAARPASEQADQISNPFAPASTPRSKRRRFLLPRLSISVAIDEPLSRVSGQTPGARVMRAAPRPCLPPRCQPAGGVRIRQ